MTVPVSIEALGPRHDRKAFACGAEPLDRYLSGLARQVAKRRVANCLVTVGQGGVIAGY